MAYLVLTLITGRSATALAPPDLGAKASGVGLAQVKAWLGGADAHDPAALRRSIGKLATAGYEPNLFAGKKKPTAGKKKKKIAGGCG